MKILLYGLNFWPELTGIGKYSGEMVEWLAQRGHEIEVVTAPPYYPEWKIKSGYNGQKYTKERCGPGNQVLLTRCPLWVPEKVTGKSRLIHLASFAISSASPLLRALARKPDVIMVVVPTLATAPLALAGASLFGVPTWLHIQDFEVDAMLDMGIVGGGKKWRHLALGIERWFLKRFQRVSSISPRMCDRLRSKGVTEEKIIEFPNWVDLSSIYPLDRPSTFRQELQIRDDEVVILYSGNMGEKQGIEVVIEAARLLQSTPSVRFILAGTGAARSRLEGIAAGLSNIIWLPLQPADRLNELLNTADIHVLPQRADAADLVMPSKLTGMLASGRCVLGTAYLNTQLGMVLQNCGRRVDPEQPEALAGAISEMVCNPAGRKALGYAGRLYAQEHLARDAILSRVERAMATLAQTR